MIQRATTLSAFLAAAQAAHLAGPMDDRLKACIAQNCPALGQAMNAPNFGGLGLQGPGGMSSFGAFVAPPMNGAFFINDMKYALNVMGYYNDSIQYRQKMGGPPNVTGTVNHNLTDVFSCACDKCAGPVEAIFQPVGRMICKEFGHDLPCSAEMDACIAANPLGAISTGSMQTHDLKFTPVGAKTRNSAVCWPEASFSAYKVGYNLTQDCNAAGTALTVGGGSTALALAKCVAKSRTEAFDKDFNCLDIGGLTCGAPYKCTQPACKVNSGRTVAMTYDTMPGTSTGLATVDQLQNVRCNGIGTWAAPNFVTGETDYKLINESVPAAAVCPTRGAEFVLSGCEMKKNCSDAIQYRPNMIADSSYPCPPNMLLTHKQYCAVACKDGYHLKEKKFDADGKKIKSYPQHPVCYDDTLSFDADCVEDANFTIVFIILGLLVFGLILVPVVQYFMQVTAFNKKKSEGFAWNGKGELLNSSGEVVPGDLLAA